MDLNNREIALLVWLGIGFLWALSFSQTRRSVRGLLASFVQPAILGLVLAFAAWIAGAVFLAAQIGLWEGPLINETVIWFAVSGGVLFFGTADAFGREGFLRRTAGRVLSVGIIAEVFINLVVLPLWAELILLPALTFLLLLQFVSAQRNEHAQVANILDSLLAYCGLALFAYVAGSLILDPDQLDLASLARLLALPVWMTIASLPFVYLLALWMVYEKAFLRMGFWAEDKRTLRKAKTAMIKHLRLNGRKAQAFDGKWQRQLLEAAKDNETSRVMGEFRAGFTSQPATSR